MHGGKLIIQSEMPIYPLLDRRNGRRCGMIRRLRRAQEGIHFLDILLDETICEGKILVPEELVRDAGGINEKLQAKQKYELLLRIAQQSPIVLEEISGKESSDGYVILGADEADCSAEQGCVTDCYVIGKYSGELKAAGCFDMAIIGVLEQAQKSGWYLIWNIW